MSSTSSKASRYLVWGAPRWQDPLFRARLALLLLGVGLQSLFTFAFRQPLFGWLALSSCIWPYRSVVVVTQAGLLVRWLAFRRHLPAERWLGAELSARRFGAVLTIRLRGGPDLALRGPPELIRRLQADLLSAFEVR
jgi:hypothetical protein